MSLFNVLIVEDEFIIAEDAGEIVQELGYNVIGNVRNFDEAIEVLNLKKVDIALIDINLGEEKDGVDLAAEIRKTYHIPFIFITSNSDVSTVNRAKVQKPNGYLLKPFDKKDLYTSIEIALSNYNIEPVNNDAEKKDFIFVKDSNTFVKLKLSDIWFVKSEGNYVSIKTEKKSYLIRSSLKEFSVQLPTNLFFQTHKSYLINLDCIDSISGQIVMVKSFEVPIGRDFKDSFMKRVNL